MAIAQNLAQILAAKYGKDVRQAIHDAIEENYEDVSTAKTLANTATNSANTAALNANEKAGLADSAATAATVAAYEAQLATGLLRPKGTYANLAALNAGTPTVADTNEIYITLDDGKWCYHNGAAWVSGGVYLAASVPDDIAMIKSVAVPETDVSGALLRVYPVKNTKLKVVVGAGATKVVLMGKNLWKIDTGRTTSGITMTVATDGTVTLNGTATHDALFTATFLVPLPAGTYTLSTNNSVAVGTSATNGVALRLGTAEGTVSASYAYCSTVDAKRTVTTTAPITVIAIRVSSGVTLSNFIIKPQLEAGSKKTAYEKYVTAAYDVSESTAAFIDVLAQPDNLMEQANTLYSNAGEITVTYKKNMIQSERHLTNVIRGTIQTITKNPDGTVQKVVHTNAVTASIVREDVFAYAPNLITEVRTLANGESITFLYHTDTLITEVV